MSDLSAISIMFEEIKQFLKRIEQSKTSDDNIANRGSCICTSGIADVENHISQSEERILAKLEQIEQVQTAPQRIRHEIAIDIRSSWVPLAIAGLILFLITSLVLCYKLKQANDNLSDNDLKYRYVKAFNKADTVNIYRIEDIFEYNRDTKAIKKIRQSVEKYERDIADRAKRLEQARLKEEEAEQLKNEAEKLKSNK